MPERWETELGKLATLEPPPRIRARIDEGPRGEGVPPMPGRGQRIAAGFVALSVFAGAAAFALGAFGDGRTVGGGTGEPLVIRLDLSKRDPVAIFEFDGVRLEQASEILSDPPQVHEAFPVPVPVGTPIEIQGGSERWDVMQAVGEVMSVEDLATRFPETMLLDPLPGSLIPDIEGTSALSVSVPEAAGDGSLNFTIIVDIYRPGNGAVAEVPFLSGTMTAPDDGSVPQLQLRYGDVVRSIHPQGGNWLGGPVGWDLVLQSFPAVPLGTQVAFDGDVHEVTATLRYGTTPESPTERLKDGFADLPDVPGEYLIHVTGEWPQGTAEFTFLVSLRDPDALTVSWGDYVHAVFGDQDVELTEIPGGDPLAVDPETLIVRTIEVPERSDMWAISDTDTLAAWLQDDGGSKAPFENLDFPRRAAVFRDAPAGEFFLILQGAQGRDVLAYVLRLRIVPSATSTEGVPAPADELVATLEAPVDGSLPTITLAYRGEEQVFTTCGGRWNGELLGCLAVLLSFGSSLEPGSTLVVRSDTDAVEAGLTVLDQDLRSTDETIAQRHMARRHGGALRRDHRR